MKKLLVKVDFNKTAADNVAAIAAFARKRHNALLDPRLHYSRETIVWKQFPTVDEDGAPNGGRWVCSPSNLDVLRDELYQQKEIFLEYVLPLGNFLAVARRILSDGHRLQLVSRGSVSEEMMALWLEHYEFHRRMLTVTGDDKTNEYAEADVAVDNEYRNFEGLLRGRNRRGTLPLLMTSRETILDLRARRIQSLAPIQTVRSWEGVYWKMQQRESVLEAA